MVELLEVGSGQRYTSCGSQPGLSFKTRCGRTHFWTINRKSNPLQFSHFQISEANRLFVEERHLFWCHLANGLVVCKSASKSGYYSLYSVNTEVQRVSRNVCSCLPNNTVCLYQQTLHAMARCWFLRCTFNRFSYLICLSPIYCMYCFSPCCQLVI